MNDDVAVSQWAAGGIDAGYLDGKEIGTIVHIDSQITLAAADFDLPGKMGVIPTRSQSNQIPICYADAGGRIAVHEVALDNPGIPARACDMKIE